MTPVAQPVLYLAGALDSAYRFGSPDPMRARVPGLREIVLLRGCGQWTQQERPAELNEHLVAFLRAEFGRAG
jgi:pimeloyl-ACP methyl ester carboxylesterase